MGRMLGGVGNLARGVAGAVNPFGGTQGDDDDRYLTTGGSQPQTPTLRRRKSSPVPSDLDDAVASAERDRLNEWYERAGEYQQLSSIYTAIHNGISSIYTAIH